MGLEALVWYCRPLANGVWAKEVDSAFGAYTPCAIDSLVICISHLVLLGLCLYRIWLIIDNNTKVKKYCLRTNYYNYMLGFFGCLLHSSAFIKVVYGCLNLQSGWPDLPFSLRAGLLDC